MQKEFGYTDTIVQQIAAINRELDVQEDYTQSAQIFALAAAFGTSGGSLHYSGKVTRHNASLDGDWTQVWSGSSITGLEALTPGDYVVMVVTPIYKRFVPTLEISLRRSGVSSIVFRGAHDVMTEHTLTDVQVGDILEIKYIPPPMYTNVNIHGGYKIYHTAKFKSLKSKTLPSNSVSTIPTVRETTPYAASSESNIGMVKPDTIQSRCNWTSDDVRKQFPNYGWGFVIVQDKFGRTYRSMLRTKAERTRAEVLGNVRTCSDDYCVCNEHKLSCTEYFPYTPIVLQDKEHIVGNGVIWKRYLVDGRLQGETYTLCELPLYWRAKYRDVILDVISFEGVRLK